MRKLNQKGFGGVESLLIVIIALLVGFIGYYVYHTQKSANNTLSQTSQSTQSSSAKPKFAIPAGWQKVDRGSYTFAYPSDWVKKDCDNNLTLLGPNSDSASACNTDGTAQVSMFSAIGDTTANYRLAKGDYPDLQIAAVKVDGVKGTKSSGTLQLAQEVFIGPQDGSKVIEYVFYSKGTTYAFVYTQTPSYTDVASTFNKLVTQTVKFQ